MDENVLNRHCSFRALQRMETEREDYEAYLASLPKGARGAAQKGATKKVIGVDFGTSSLRCAILDDSKVSIIEDREGSRCTPAYVFLEGGWGDNETEPVLGRLAKGKLYARPGEVKPVHRILAEAKKEDGEEAKVLAKRSAGAMLREVMVEAVEKRGAGDIGECDCVLTYSPGFDEYQQELLVEAGKNAGLSDPLILCEPASALIAAEHQGIISKDKKSKPCVVVDVGHSVTHMSLVEGDALVCSLSCDMGGEMLQRGLVNHIAEKFSKSNGGIDLLSDELSLQRMHDVAEECAAELGKKKRAHVDLPFITADAKGPKHLKETVSIDVLESIMNDSVKSSTAIDGGTVEAALLNMLMKTLESGNKTPFQLGAVLLVGAASRQPIFERSLTKAMASLGGDQFSSEMLAAVEGGRRAELNAMGAALAMPS